MKTDIIKLKNRSTIAMGSKTTIKAWCCTATAEKIFADIEKATDDLYHQLDTHEAWGVGGDVVCDNCETRIKKIIKEIKKKYLGDEK